MKRVPDDKLVCNDDGQYRLDGKPFTGVGFILNKKGWTEAETEYRNGLESGFKREWASPKRLLYEAEFRDGVIHGRKRRWLRDGTLTEQGDYEYGIPIREKTWDEHGKLIDDYELQKTDANYTLLERYRSEDPRRRRRG